MSEATSRNGSRRAARLRLLEMQLARVRKELPWSSRLIHGILQAIMSVTAAVLAYVPAEFLGLRESFWAAITAIGVVQTEFGSTRTTARDQFTGAAIGGIVGLGVALLMGEGLARYALAVALSVLVCWIANIASAARLSGITATIILLVPHPGVTPTQMMVARVSEVAWGVTMAIAVVWIASRIGLARAKPRG